MKVMRKFPPNPNLVMYLVNQQLTEKMSEVFWPGTKQNYGESLWVNLYESIEKIVAIDGIKRVQIIPYEIRVFKNRELQWAKVLTEIEKIFAQFLFVKNIQEYKEEEPVEKSFEVFCDIIKKEVYEGKNMAAKNLLAEKLFELPGIERVILETEQVTIKKSCWFYWQQLLPKIEHIFRESRVSR